MEKIEFQESNKLYMDNLKLMKNVTISKNNKKNKIFNDKTDDMTIETSCAFNADMYSRTTSSKNKAQENNYNKNVSENMGEYISENVKKNSNESINNKTINKHNIKSKNTELPSHQNSDKHYEHYKECDSNANKNKNINNLHNHVKTIDKANFSSIEKYVSNSECMENKSKKVLVSNHSCNIPLKKLEQCDSSMIQNANNNKLNDLSNFTTTNNNNNYNNNTSIKYTSLIKKKKNQQNINNGKKKKRKANEKELVRLKLNPHTNKEKTNNEKTNNEKTNNEKTNNEKTNNEKTNNEKTNNEKTNNEKTNNKKTNNKKTNNNSSVTQWNKNNEEINKKSILCQYKKYKYKIKKKKIKPKVFIKSVLYSDCISPSIVKLCNEMKQNLSFYEREVDDFLNVIRNLQNIVLVEREKYSELKEMLKYTTEEIEKENNKLYEELSIYKQKYNKLKSWISNIGYGIFFNNGDYETKSYKNSVMDSTSTTYMNVEKVYSNGLQEDMGEYDYIMVNENSNTTYDIYNKKYSKMDKSFDTSLLNYLDF
ncbi:conserved protein, unknown function [Hepatocystis sp. ex Piliocolobus tephrosceles]|nr:conserved protein, unknown function [Hepatocystis sp. ex Piliocolobus tephrosceles]